jgi:hypothetical protein
MENHIHQVVTRVVIGYLVKSVIILGLMFVIVELTVILYLMFVIAMSHLVVVVEDPELQDQPDQQEVQDQQVQ